RTGAIRARGAHPEDHEEPRQQAELSGVPHASAIASRRRARTGQSSSLTRRARRLWPTAAPNRGRRDVARQNQVPYPLPMSRPPLHYQILIALGLAVVVGLSLRAAPIDPAPFAEGFEFAGALFLRLLKMLVVPLIAASIIAGVASVGGTQGFGRLGLKTGGYYLCTTILSVSLGLLLVNVIEPGIVDGSPARDRIGLDAEAAEVSREVAGRTE